MPYLGTQAAVGFSQTTKDRFSGDNSTTGFTMSKAASTATDIQVFVDNIRQEPTIAYSTSGATLTFTEAPPTGTNNVYVIHQHQALGTGPLPPQDLGTTDYIFGDDISFNSDGAVINFGLDSEIKLVHVHNSGLSLNTDGHALLFGADSEVSLTHVADTGLLLNSTSKLMFGDSASFIQQSSDGVLRIDGETTIDINGAVDISGNTALGGTLDMNGGELILDADADTSITADTDDRIDIKIAGSDVAGFDASGNFHIGNGTATNDGAIHINAGASAKNIVLEADRASDGQGLGNIQWHSAGTNVAQLSAERAASDSSADMVFYTYANGGSLGQRMRIDDGGNIIFGGSTAPAINGTNADEKCVIESDGEFILQGAAKVLMYLNRNQTAGEIVSIRQGNTAVGGIDANSSSVDFNTSSDYRLKENVTTSWDATTRLKQLKPVRFSWKVDGKSEADTDGFLAHEVNDVVPQATKGTKDEVVTQKGIDEGTYPKDSKVGDAYMQSIDHSKLVPLLVKTIQEAMTRIETLETEVTKLKG